MPFFQLANLTAQEVTPCDAPWKIVLPVPDEVKGKNNKVARTEWINRPDTEHCCYSSFEGFADNIRIADSKTNEGNPPFRLHAFIADIDAQLSDAEIAVGVGRIDFPPNYLERTLSGNVRLIWLFEKPVAFPNRRFAVEFLELALSRFRFELVGVAFDKPAFLEPNRYYTNSGVWMEGATDARIPHSLLQGLVVKVAEKHLWKKDRGAVDIPLPVVYEELCKKFPQLPSVWVGEFLDSSAGPSFFVEGSSSPRSAIVKPTGMFTFSAHAIKPFYSWTDLLGKSFVDKYAAQAMGKAVDGILFDGNKYWRKDGYGDWKNFSKEDTVCHLSIDRGLATTKGEDATSETTRAIQYIQNWQNIVGAAPFVFQPPGVLSRQGNKFLNTHTRKVCSPATEKVVWGAEGPMPFYSQFFDGLFHPDSTSTVPGKPLEYFLSWLSRFYKGCYLNELESGQNIFLLGKQGVGKTFLNQGLLPYLFGGGAEAEAYLLGKSDFNSELFEVAFWSIDDNSATISDQIHRKFSAMVKKMAANTTFQYHAKFRVPCTVDWMGRVFVTANDDEQSASIVPDLAISILDKIMVFWAASNPGVVFPSRKDCQRIIQQETPHLARFLLDYQIPEHCKGTSRFGVVSYHEASLVKTAEQSSTTSAFVEMLHDWRQRYFDEHPDLTCWEGTAFQFLRELNKDLATAAAGARSINTKRLQNEFAAVSAKGNSDIRVVDTSGETRIWRISSPRKNPSRLLPQLDSFNK